MLLSPDGSFSATVAGHPPILKVDTKGKVVDRIGEGAYPLGIKTGVQWNEVQDSLATGERLVLHSDGLTEARNADDREFGDPYVEAVVGWNGKASAGALLNALVEEWKKFCGKRPAEDDISIAVLERR